MANVSQMVEAAGNLNRSLNTSGLNYSQALQAVSHPQTAEQALLLFKSNNPLALLFVLLAFAPAVAVFFAGGILEMYTGDNAFEFWVLELACIAAGLLGLGVVPFLLSG